MTNLFRALPAVLLVWAAGIIMAPRPCAAQPASDRPGVVLTQADISAVRAALDGAPLLATSYRRVRERVERALAAPMDVPQPVDAGGYTHERHKQNYVEMLLAGQMYAITGERKYVSFVREMLLRYAALYPTLGRHPKAKGEAPGRLFWQVLNETVWLCHVAQAYDCVYDALSLSDRSLIETRLLRPMANYFTDAMPWHHDQAHNHGTWSCAAVGLLGYALKDTVLIRRALYGTRLDRKGGFFFQIDNLFSPDGYYTEGPYYFRYAIWPFYWLAQAVENNQPSLKIFDYRSQVLKKALLAGLTLTSETGHFFPFNDALKEKSILTPELSEAIPIYVQRYGLEENLISIAMRQGEVSLSSGGAAIAAAAKTYGGPPPLAWRTVELRDGPDGTRGGVSILRSGAPGDQMILGFKYTSHGLSHGHYDRLQYFLYDQSREIIQDYGSARFINVEPKDGGRYLPENTSWAVQSIAHNTVTVDERSQFLAVEESSEAAPPSRFFTMFDDTAFQVASARADGMYPGVGFQRTMALVRLPGLDKPVVLDVFRIESDAEHRYDHPLYYCGQFLWTNVTIRRPRQLTPLGSAYGYQHLWMEGEGAAAGSVRVSWLSGNRYYTSIAAADSATDVTFVRIGASDPNVNLRSEPGVILRKRARNHTFAQVIEPHGCFDGVREISRDVWSDIESVSVLRSDAEYTVIALSGKKSRNHFFFVANATPSPSQRHTVRAAGKTFSWTGNASLQRGQ
jgi:hypothetical protein